ncbi:transmembrane protein 182 [Pitangus sulphuratus]|nr:transmembrane protein 182 [Pitangus sulphuratus]
MCRRIALLDPLRRSRGYYFQKKRISYLILFQEEKATFHHEGFFWRCWFSGNVGDNNASMWNFWYTNQSPSKNCTHAYLSPFPLLRDEHNSTSYDSAIIYRGFWTVLMLLGVLTVVMASFFIICAAPFASHILYKAGGGFFIIAGVLFSLVVVMYVIWVQAMADLENYTNMKKMDCPDFAVYKQGPVYQHITIAPNACFVLEVAQYTINLWVSPVLVVPEEMSLVGFRTECGKAGMPPVGCAFKLALLPATVQRSKKEQKLFPRIPKGTHRKTLQEMAGKGSEFSDHFV